MPAKKKTHIKDSNERFAFEYESSFRYACEAFN